MSDAVMSRLLGWSPARLAAWRKALRQPAARHRVERLRAVLPPETVASAVAEIESAAPNPVGESLAVTFEQLSPMEQRAWRALAADDALSPQRRSQAMVSSGVAERGHMARLCDAATARAQRREQGRLFTDVELDECIPERLKLPAL